MKLDNYKCDGQINIYDWLKATQPKECNFSGHTCNKKELWKVAHTLDDIECPETCCRNCDVKMCGARCNGSEEPEKIYELDLKGFCDDPYCPKCGYEFVTWSDKSEVDCKRCPKCNIRIDWTRYHRVND